jgi:hypothetical protein
MSGAEVIEEILTPGAKVQVAKTSVDLSVTTTIKTSPQPGQAVTPVQFASGAVVGDADGETPHKPKNQRKPRTKSVKYMSGQEKHIFECEQELLAWVKKPENRTHIPSMWAGAKNGDFDPLKVIQAVEKEKARWSSQYLKLWRFPDFFIRGVLKRFNSSRSDEDLQKIQDYDAEQPWQVLTFCTGLNRNWNWSHLLHDKDLLDRVIDLLYVMYGRRIDGDWWSKYVSAEGKVDFDAGGVMRKRCDNKENANQVTHMVHCSGGAECNLLEKAPGMVVDKSLPTQENWSDPHSNTKAGMFHPLWIDQCDGKLNDLKKMMTSAALDNLAKKTENQLQNDQENVVASKAHHEGVATKKRKLRGESAKMLKDAVAGASVDSTSASASPAKVLAGAPSEAPPSVEVVI